jgi:hypothetical protein
VDSKLRKLSSMRRAVRRGRVVDDQLGKVSFGAVEMICTISLVTGAKQKRAQDASEEDEGTHA